MTKGIIKTFIEDITKAVYEDFYESSRTSFFFKI